MCVYIYIYRYIMYIITLYKVMQGDTDASVDWIGTKAWVESLPWPSVGRRDTEDNKYVHT